MLVNIKQTSKAPPSPPHTTLATACSPNNKKKNYATAKKKRPTYDKEKTSNRQEHYCKTKAYANPPNPLPSTSSTREKKRLRRFPRGGQKMSLNRVRWPTTPPTTATSAGLCVLESVLFSSFPRRRRPRDLRWRCGAQAWRPAHPHQTHPRYCCNMKGKQKAKTYEMEIDSDVAK